MKRRKILRFLPLALLPANWSRGATSKPSSGIRVNGRAETASAGAARPKRDNTWLVGYMRDDPKEHENTWSVVGVYNDEQKAIEACSTQNYFVGPLRMNETNDEGDFDLLNEDESPWPGMWIPYNFGLIRGRKNKSRMRKTANS